MRTYFLFFLPKKRRYLIQCGFFKRKGGGGEEFVFIRANTLLYLKGYSGYSWASMRDLVVAVGYF